MLSAVSSRFVAELGGFEEIFISVVVVAVGLWKSLQRFPRAVVCVGNGFIVFHAFHSPSIPPPLPVAMRSSGGGRCWTHEVTAIRNDATAKTDANLVLRPGPSNQGVHIRLARSPV
jgi:hypothetical protein